MKWIIILHLIFIFSASLQANELINNFDISYKLIDKINFSETLQRTQIEKIYQKDNFINVKNKLKIRYTEKDLIIRINIKDYSKIKNNLIYLNLLVSGKMLILDDKYNIIEQYVNKGDNFNSYNFFRAFKPNGSMTYYVIRDSKLTYSGYVELISVKDYNQKNLINFVIICMFVGSFIYLALYHIAFYFISKDVSYVYYVLFNSFYIIINVSMGNFFSTMTNSYFIEENTITFTAVAIMFLSFFAKNFLKLELYISKRKFNILRILEITALFFAFLNFFLNGKIVPIISTGIDIIVLITISYLSYLAFNIRKQNIYANFYLSGWLFTFLGIVLLYSYRFISPFEGSTHFSRYFLLIGCFLEMVINSFGLAYQYKQLALEKNKANLEARDKKRYQNAVKILIHDIATPLTSSMMSIEMLKMKNNMKPYLDDVALKVLDTIEKSNEKIKLIMDDTRQYEKEYELSDINQSKSDDIFKEINDLFNLKLNEKNIKLVKYGKNIDIPVKGSLLVNNILGNILSNCIKFSHENSSIFFTFNETSSYHEIIIKDQGIGMNEEQLHKIRNMVITSSLGTNKEKGTGFGMQIATTLINEFNGTLEINSSNDKDNHGSEFIIRFKK